MNQIDYELNFPPRPIYLMSKVCKTISGIIIGGGGDKSLFVEYDFD